MFLTCYAETSRGEAAAASQGYQRSPVNILNQRRPTANSRFRFVQIQVFQFYFMNTKFQMEKRCLYRAARSDLSLGDPRPRAAMVAEVPCDLTSRQPPSQVVDNLPRYGDYARESTLWRSSNRFLYLTPIAGQIIQHLNLGVLGACRHAPYIVKNNKVRMGPALYGKSSQ